MIKDIEALPDSAIIIGGVIDEATRSLETKLADVSGYSALESIGSDMIRQLKYRGMPKLVDAFVPEISGRICSLPNSL